MSNPNLLTPQDEREITAEEQEAAEQAMAEFVLSPEMRAKILAELGGEAVAGFQAEAPNN